MSMALAVEAVQANQDAKLKKNMRVSVSNDVDPWQPNKPAIRYYASTEPEEGDGEDDGEDDGEAQGAYEEEDDFDSRSARRPGAGKAALVLTACALLHRVFVAPGRRERRRKGRARGGQPGRGSRSSREDGATLPASHPQLLNDHSIRTAEDPLLASVRAKLEQMSVSNDNLTNKINKLREEISAQLQNVRQPVLGVDRNGLITFWNQTAEILTGFDGPAIYEHEFVSTLVDPAEHTTLYQALSKVLVSGRCAELDEVSVRYQGGEVGKWAIAFSPTSEFGHTRAFVVCTDLSEILRLRDQALVMRGECVSSAAKLTKMEMTNKLLQQQILDLQNEPRRGEGEVRAPASEQLQAALTDLQEMTSKYNMQKDAALSAEATAEELRLVNDSQSKEMADLVKMMHQLSAEAHKIAQSNRELTAANARLEEREAKRLEQPAKPFEEVAGHAEGKTDDEAEMEASEGSPRDLHAAREALMAQSSAEGVEAPHLETYAQSECGTGASETDAATAEEAGTLDQSLAQAPAAHQSMPERSSVAEAKARVSGGSVRTGADVAPQPQLETRTAIEDGTGDVAADPEKPQALQATHTQGRAEPNLQTFSTSSTSTVIRGPSADEPPPLAQVRKLPEQAASDWDARVRCTLGQTQRRLDLDQASHPAFILTASREVALWNAAAARSVMRRRDDVVGRSLSGFLWGSDAAARLDKVLLASEGESVVTQELALTRSDLGVVSWLVSCMCVRDAGGEVLEYVCTVQKITEPKSASSRLTPRSMSEATDPVSLAKAETAQILAKLQEYGVPNACMVAKGIYDVAGRRIIIAVRHNKEMVRVGGGYVPLGKFLRQYDTRGYAASSSTTPSQSGTSTPAMTPRGSHPISRNASVNNSPPKRGPSDTSSNVVSNSTAPVGRVPPGKFSYSHSTSQAAAQPESSSEYVGLTEVRANTVGFKVPNSANDSKSGAGRTVPALNLSKRKPGTNGSERKTEELASPMSASSHQTSDEFHTPRSSLSAAQVAHTGSGDRSMPR